MDIFDSIGDAFKSAADAVADVATKIAVVTVNGANLFGSGWKDVFSGNIQQGFSEIGIGLAAAVGVPVPGMDMSQLGETYADILGQAAQWGLQEYHTTNQLQCYSAYKAKVEGLLQSKSIPWNNDTMESKLREGAVSLGFIDMNC